MYMNIYIHDVIKRSLKHWTHTHTQTYNFSIHIKFYSGYERYRLNYTYV